MRAGWPGRPTTCVEAASDGIIEVCEVIRVYLRCMPHLQELPGLENPSALKLAVLSQCWQSHLLWGPCSQRKQPLQQRQFNLTCKHFRAQNSNHDATSGKDKPAAQVLTFCSSSS